MDITNLANYIIINYKLLCNSLICESTYATSMYVSESKDYICLRETKALKNITNCKRRCIQNIVATSQNHIYMYFLLHDIMN